MNLGSYGEDERKKLEEQMEEMKRVLAAKGGAKTD